MDIKLSKNLLLILNFYSEHSAAVALAGSPPQASRQHHQDLVQGEHQSIAREKAHLPLPGQWIRRLFYLTF
jgi:hypothetical protein